MNMFDETIIDIEVVKFEFEKIGSSNTVRDETFYIVSGDYATSLPMSIQNKI